MSDAPTPSMSPQPDSSQAASKVNGPAIGLMVTAGIGMVLQIGGLLMRVLGISVMAANADGPAAAQMMGGAILGSVVPIMGIIFGVAILLGAMKMKNLESYGLAMTASILALLPCISPCCLITLPFGIWAIIVLSDASVKAAFR